jgi:zinc protease
VTDGPTATELTRAKRNLVDGFPLRIDSNRKLLDYLAVIGFYGPAARLPRSDFVGHVEAVTVAADPRCLQSSHRRSHGHRRRRVRIAAK